MLQAKAGKSPFQVHARLPKRPKGGTMFLIETQRFFEKSDTTAKTLSQDGYMWTEILHQSDLITAKDNHLDYRYLYTLILLFIASCIFKFFKKYKIVCSNIFLVIKITLSENIICT